MTRRFDAVSTDGPIGCLPGEAPTRCRELDDAVAAMERDRVRRIPVVDEREHLTGIVTQADLARKVGPNNPAIMEHMLERISEPVRTAAGARPS